MNSDLFSAFAAFRDREPAKILRATAVALHEAANPHEALVAEALKLAAKLAFGEAQVDSVWRDEVAEFLRTLS